MNIQTIHKIERELAVARFLQEALSHQYFDDQIDPFTIGIVQDVPRLAKLQVSLLAATTLRWKELNRLNVLQFIEGEAQSIKQYKTKTLRMLPGIQSPPWIDRPIWRTNWPIHRCSYDSIRLAIKRETPRRLREELADQNDATHIFRHLRASWLHMQGLTLEQIKSYFAHQSTEATEQYVHPELFANLANIN